MVGHFDILSIRNPVVKELLHLRLTRRERLKQGIALVRGRQLIQTIGRHFPFKRIFTHEDADRWDGYNAERILRVTKPILSHILFPPSRPGEYVEKLDDDEFVIGTIDQPKPMSEMDGPIRFMLALDGIKQPENMGLLLTTAVALKYDCAFVLEKSIDPYNYKVLEASQGVAWTFPYRYGTAEDLLALCERFNLEPCAAHIDGPPISELPPWPSELRGFCLAIGNESRGVQEGLLKHCRRISLPMSDLSDSLNAGVAGGVLMHALACSWRR